MASLASRQGVGGGALGLLTQARLDEFFNTAEGAARQHRDNAEWQQEEERRWQEEVSRQRLSKEERAELARAEAAQAQRQWQEKNGEDTTTGAEALEGGVGRVRRCRRGGVGAGRARRRRRGRRSGGDCAFC